MGKFNWFINTRKLVKGIKYKSSPHKAHITVEYQEDYVACLQCNFIIRIYKYMYLFEYSCNHNVHTYVCIHKYVTHFN
jgi:hypothetical protein